MTSIEQKVATVAPREAALLKGVHVGVICGGVGASLAGLAIGWANPFHVQAAPTVYAMLGGITGTSMGCLAGIGVAEYVSYRRERRMNAQTPDVRAGLEAITYATPPSPRE